MKITISDDRKIFAIQEEFNVIFPSLKLEFFSKASKVGGVPSKEIVNKSKTLGECRTIHNKGSITITPNMLVSELEENFRDVYGLEIEILVNTGGTWKEIINDDGQTLGELNVKSEKSKNAIV